MQRTTTTGQAAPLRAGAGYGSIQARVMAMPAVSIADAVARARGAGSHRDTMPPAWTPRGGMLGTASAAA